MFFECCINRKIKNHSNITIYCVIIYTAKEIEDLMYQSSQFMQDPHLTDYIMRIQAWKLT